MISPKELFLATCSWRAEHADELCESKSGRLRPVKGFPGIFMVMGDSLKYHLDGELIDIREALQLHEDSDPVGTRLRDWPEYYGLVCGERILRERASTSRDFVYWLQGFFEITEATTVTESQVKIIRNHLNLVFKHEIDPSIDGGDQETKKVLKKVHDGGSNPKVAEVLEKLNEEALSSNPLIRCRNTKHS